MYKQSDIAYSAENKGVVTVYTVWFWPKFKKNIYSNQDMAILQFHAAKYVCLRAATIITQKCSYVYITIHIMRELDNTIYKY